MSHESLLDEVIAGLAKRRGEHREIARISGVPYSTLKKIWNGETPNPGVRPVQRLADAMRGMPMAGDEEKAGGVAA